jgi:NADH pyrophosphatase NudC (nudix superfamily)
MQEEIGVRVEPGRLLMTQTKHDGGLRLFCWSAIIIAGRVTPNPLEIADARWMTPGEIRRASGVLPGTTAILDAIGL